MTTPLSLHVEPGEALHHEIVAAALDEYCDRVRAERLCEQMRANGWVAGSLKLFERVVRESCNRVNNNPVTLEDIKRKAVIDAVRACGGSRHAAAKMLNIAHTTVYDYAGKEGV